MLTYETSPELRAIAQSFARVAATTKFPPGPGLAIWACESQWGKKLTGKYNPWGITRGPEAGPADFCPTHEDITEAQLVTFRPDERATAVKVKDLGGGRFRYSMSRWFASYASFDESVEAFVDFFTQSPKRYKAAWQEYLATCDAYPNTSAASLLKAICEAGYATGDAEATELEILAQSNITNAIQMAKRDIAVAPAVIS